MRVTCARGACDVRVPCARMHERMTGPQRPTGRAGTVPSCSMRSLLEASFLHGMATASATRRTPVRLRSQAACSMAMRELWASVYCDSPGGGGGMVGGNRCLLGFFETRDRFPGFVGSSPSAVHLDGCLGPRPASAILTLAAFQRRMPPSGMHVVSGQK